MLTIAVIPLGTGNDWIKTHNIPNNEKSIEINP
jgi:diacylglycerol kinase family enzyme